MGLYYSLKFDERGIGDTFGDWTQIGPSFRINPFGAKQKYSVAVCQCKCGTIDVPLLNNLRKRTSNTCAKCRIRKTARAKLRHGLAEARVYEIWCGIKKRCLNPNSKSWKEYGARGILICDRWRDSFESFLADMGQPPTDKHEIDRIDNDGNYEPGNCRWATHKQNIRNTRRNIFVEFRGKSITIAELVEHSELPYIKVYGRLRKGVPPEEAIKA